MSTFTDLGISEPLVKALQEQQITEPTDIQEKAIPALLRAEDDFMGCAQTGTGKTAAFALPLLQQVKTEHPELQALVLCPTRELCQQTARELGLFSKHIPHLFIRAVYGGTDIDQQLKELKKPTQIIVATPGRLMDLIRRDAIDLSYLSHFILDEADEMLHMGFKDDIDFIRDRIYQDIHTWLFCATMRPEIKRLVDQYLRPGFVQVHIDPENPLNANIEHQFMVCKPDQKREGLKSFLRANPDKNGIVFCRTKAAAQEIAGYLVSNGFQADELHGDLNQKERDQVMKQFKSRGLRVLVATDIAARGLDIKGLGFVIHFHWPEQREYFTHRCGRTGRAGNKGISLCLVFQKEVKKITAVANNLGLRFTRIDMAPETEAADASPEPVLKETQAPGEMVTFYINMGKADEVNHRNLVEFICTEAGLEKKDFGKITVQKKRAYFEIHHSCIRKLVKGLENLYVDGKRLVLTREEFDIDQ